MSKFIYSCTKHPVTIGVTYNATSSGTPCAACKKSAEKAPVELVECLDRASHRARTETEQLRSAA